GAILSCSPFEIIVLRGCIEIVIVRCVEVPIGGIVGQTAKIEMLAISDSEPEDHRPEPNAVGTRIDCVVSQRSGRWLANVHQPETIGPDGRAKSAQGQGISTGFS